MLLIAILPFCAISCIDNTPEEEDLLRDAVSFEYFINPNQDAASALYYLDFYVYSKITFVNTSPATTTGTPVWDFGDGTVIEGNEVIYAYKEAGTYPVKLTIGDFSKTQQIMIAPIKPIVKIKIGSGDPAEICEVAATPITFEVELPNPQNLEAKYTWEFPSGTTTNEVEKTLVDNKYYYADTLTDLPPAVQFAHVGSLPCTLTVNLGGKDLEPAIMNVQVAHNQEVPTLYYAVQGGRIMAHKLIQNRDSNMNVYSYDLGVASGQHPFNILFSTRDTLLYVLDAGKQFYYVNDVNKVLGDGKISVVSRDGSKVQTMITNAGQAAFDDPFYGCIDGDFLYYANRNTGMVKISLDERDKIYSIDEYPWYVQQDTLGYYNNGWGYGTIGGMFGKINGIWHWTRFYNGNGIYRFKDGPWPDGDILPAAVAKGDDTNKPKAGIMLSGMSPKSFVYTKNSATPKMVFHVMDAGYNGVYCCTYEQMDSIGTSKKNLAPYQLLYDGKPFTSNTTGNLPSIEGTGSESVGICQMTYNEVDDCVYFAYRNNSAQSAAYPKTGIYCISNLGADQPTVTCLIDGVSAYGVAVNNIPSKLF